MATRSRIGILNADGTVTSVYCHWDGFPSHNGKILREHYNTPEAVKELLMGGDMSVLAPKCSKPEGHSYDNPVKGYVIYYGRDRGDLDTKARVDATEDDFWLDGEEYNYLMKNGVWTVNGEKLTAATCKKFNLN